MAIYKITNKLNNKSYIGQTIKNDPMQRIKFHFKDYESNHGYIHRAIQKYGKENFEITILDSTIDIEKLNTLEQEYIKIFNTLAPNGYNYTTGGDSGGHQSEITKIKISQKLTKHPSLVGRTPWNKGRPFSQEVRQKMSNNRKGKPRAKSLTRPFFPKQIICDDGTIYLNPREAAEYLNVKPNTIVKAINDKKILRRVKGKVLKYYY